MIATARATPSSARMRSPTAAARARIASPLVPTDHNLRPAYASFGELEVACEAFMADVNTRPHRSTLEPPVFRLAQEHERMHRLPRLPHTLCFGETRRVDWQSLISVGGAQYSVSHELVDQRVWARSTGDELVVIHVDGPAGPREVARHPLTTRADRACRTSTTRPGRRARWNARPERAFLALGHGAERWLITAAAAGAQPVRRRMAERSTSPSCTAPPRSTHALTRMRAGRPVR